MGDRYRMTQGEFALYPGPGIADKGLWMVAHYPLQQKKWFLLRPVELADSTPLYVQLLRKLVKASGNLIFYVCGGDSCENRGQIRKEAFEQRVQAHEVCLRLRLSGRGDVFRCANTRLPRATLLSLICFCAHLHPLSAS